MANLDLDRFLKGSELPRTPVLPQVNSDPKRFARTEEREHAWVFEIKENGVWKIVFGPTFSEAEVRDRIPEKGNNYRVRGSEKLGDELREAIKRQQEAAKKRR